MPSMIKTRLLPMVLIAMLVVALAAGSAAGRTDDSADEAPVAEGVPWGSIAISVGFAAAVGYLGFMNSKRTHLD